MRLLTTLVADQGRSEPLRAARSTPWLGSGAPMCCVPGCPWSTIPTRRRRGGSARCPLARDGVLPPNDLAGFLERPSPLVRAAALMVLNVKKAMPAEIKDLVLARLDDPSPDVRQAAVLAAGGLQLREAIPRLIQAAGKPDSELRGVAISALCRMPNPRRHGLSSGKQRF